jgi:hypothetical protein
MELNLKLQRLFGFALAKNMHPHGIIHSSVRSKLKIIDLGHLNNTLQYSTGSSDAGW